jgi:predicted AAA+ superfamily ATPase
MVYLIVISNELTGYMMLSNLSRWNKWGNAQLSAGFNRSVMHIITRFLDTPEVVVLTGLRRSGKSTILYQIMEHLEAQGIPREAMLHMNFEEPNLGPQLNVALLDELYDTYRNHIYPKGKVYIFFDEIQNVPQWERWVRSRNESEDIKVFITGSSANLMSRELGTLLTGRHVNFHVAPLNFSEYLQFKNIALPEHQLHVNAPHEIQHALNDFLMWGGLPEVVLSEDEVRKQFLLKQYFDDILFKDVAMRHQIRDVVLLRNIAVHLLTQSGSLITVNRIANLFSISVETASHYCNYIEEAFLVNFVGYYSLKVAERNRQPRKIYAADLGLSAVCSFSHSEDKGRQIETAVFHHLQSIAYGNIFYWKGDQEVDFLLRKGNTIFAALQVVYENLDEPKTRQREMNALSELVNIYREAKPMLVSAKMPKQEITNLMPLWIFLTRNIVIE